MANQRQLELLLKISTDGAQSLGQIEQQIQSVASVVSATFQQKPDALVSGFVQLAQTLKGTYEQAETLGKALNLDPKNITLAVQQLRQFQAVKVDTANQFEQLNKTLGLTQSQFETLSKVASEGFSKEKKTGLGGVIESLSGGLASLANPITAVSFGFNQVTESIGKVGEFGKQVFEKLLSQLVEIRSQTLGIAANLASAQQVSVGGQNIVDPIDAIKAVLPEVQKQIEQLKKDSLDTTSTTAQLIPIFQTISQQVNTLGISLGQAEKLSVRLSQSAGALNIPYQQAQQEIAGIARGEITVYNTLAKTIGLNNETLRTLIAQGRVYEFLEQKTAGLAAGQKLQAEQLPGLLSSITDSIELITQATGAPILDAILPGVKAVLDFLKQNQEQFETIGKSVTTFFVEVGQRLFEAGAIIGQALTPLLQAFGQNINEAAGLFATTIKALADTLVVLAQVAAPIIEVIGTLVKAFSDLAASDLGGVVVQLAAFAAIAILFVPAILGVVGAISGFVEAAIALSAALPLLIGLMAPLEGGLLGVAAAGSAALLPLAIAAAPFIALAAAIGVAVVALKTLELASTNEAVEALSQSTDRLADESLSYAAKLKALHEVEKNGGKLTEAQLLQRKQLLTLSKGTTESIDQQITDLKALQPANQEQANALKVQIALLEKRKELLANNSGLGLGNKALIEIGTAREQIQTELDSATKDLLNPEKAEEAAKRLGKASQEAVSAGILTRAEAAKSLDAVFNNKGLTRETQLAARKEADDLLKASDDDRVADVSSREKRLESLVKAGQLSQVEGEKEITEAKGQEIERRLEATRSELRRALEASGGRTSPQVEALRRQQTELEDQRLATTEKGVEDRSKAELEGLKNQTEALKGKRAEGLVTEQAFTTQSIALSQKQTKAQIAEIERQKKLLDPSDTAGLEVLNAKAAGLKQQSIKTIADLTKQGNQDEIDAAKAKETLIQDAINAGTVSQVEGQKQLTAAKLAELDKELEANKKLQSVTPKGTVESNRLIREQKELEAQKTGVVEKGNRDRAQAALTAADNEDKILEGKRVRGLIDESAFADQSLAITKRRIDLELKELERERALLKPGDTAGQQDIDAKEAALNGKREQAEEQFQARKLAIVERAQKKAEDAAKLSEVSRNTEIDKLLAARQIREVEAGLLRVQSAKNTIAQELELEKQKLAALLKLPALTDPVKEEERQVKIRASRIKSAELTDNLVKNEIEQQQALLRVVSDRLDRQAQAAKNNAQSQTLPLQNQIELQGVLTKSLENQNKLLDARKGLQDAVVGFAQGELGILSQTAKTQQDKDKLATIAAAAKFKALQFQQAIERQSLELQIKQNEAALEREKIQNRIAQIQNQADQAQAEADLAKAKADPNATPESIRAAELNLKVKQTSGVGLESQGAVLDQQGKIDAQLNDLKRQTLNVTQASQQNEARSNLIGTLPKGLKEQAQQNLEQDILQQLGLGNAIGSVNTDQIQAAALQRGGVGNFNLPGNLQPNLTNAPLPLVESPEVKALTQKLDTLTQQAADNGGDLSATRLATLLPNAAKGQSVQIEANLKDAIDKGAIDLESNPPKGATDTIKRQREQDEKQTQLEALQKKRAQLVELTDAQYQGLSDVKTKNDHGKTESGAQTPLKPGQKPELQTKGDASADKKNADEQGFYSRAAATKRVQEGLAKAEAKLRLADKLEFSTDAKPAEFARAQAKLEPVTQAAIRPLNLIPPVQAIQPVRQSNDLGNAAILTELKRLTGAALRPIEAPVTQNIQGPDAATVAKMARRETEAGLIKALRGVK